MKILIIVAAAAVMLGAIPCASASPITYTFSGTSITFGGSGTDTITGSFAYDSSLSSQQLSNVNITVAGPVYPSVSSTSFCAPCAANQIYFGPPGGIPDYVMDFGSNLNGTTAPLTFGSFYSNSTQQLFQSSNVSGNVFPTMGYGAASQSISVDFPSNSSQYSFDLTGAPNQPTYLSVFDTPPATNDVELSVAITPLYPQQGQNTYACSLLNPCDVFTELVNTLLIPTSECTTGCQVNFDAVEGVQGQIINIQANNNLPPGGQLATPLPLTLPPFATGLGGLALLGWRRKRKAQVVAA